MPLKALLKKEDRGHLSLRSAFRVPRTPARAPGIPDWTHRTPAHNPGTPARAPGVPDRNPRVPDRSPGIPGRAPEISARNPRIPGRALGSPARALGVLVKILGIRPSYWESGQIPRVPAANPRDSSEKTQRCCCDQGPGKTNLWSPSPFAPSRRAAAHGGTPSGVRSRDTMDRSMTGGFVPQPGYSWASPTG